MEDSFFCLKKNIKMQLFFLNIQMMSQGKLQIPIHARTQKVLSDGQRGSTLIALFFVFS